MRTPTPRRLWNYLTRRLRLKRYLQSPGDGRRQPQIPAQALLWAMLVGQILREYSFHAVEALVCSPARRNLCIRASFGDDALGYFTERLDPAPMRAALALGGFATSFSRTGSRNGTGNPSPENTSRCPYLPPHPKTPANPLAPALLISKLPKRLALPGRTCKRSET